MKKEGVGLLNFEIPTSVTNTKYLADEEVEQEDEFHHMYSSLPPTQILERAAQVVEEQQPSSSGLDMMGGLKFMLRSRSFLLRPPFHKKNSAGRSRSRGSDSPFR